MLPVFTASRHFFVHICVWSFYLGIASEISCAPHGTSAGLTLSQSPWPPWSNATEQEPGCFHSDEEHLSKCTKMRVGVTRPVTCRLNRMFSFNMDQRCRKKKHTDHTPTCGPNKRTRVHTHRQIPPIHSQQEHFYMPQYTLFTIKKVTGQLQRYCNTK